MTRGGSFQHCRVHAALPALEGELVILIAQVRIHQVPNRGLQAKVATISLLLHYHSGPPLNLALGVDLLIIWFDSALCRLILGLPFLLCSIGQRFGTINQMFNPTDWVRGRGQTDRGGHTRGRGVYDISTYSSGKGATSTSYRWGGIAILSQVDPRMRPLIL